MGGKTKKKTEKITFRLGGLHFVSVCCSELGGDGAAVSPGCESVIKVPEII